MFEGKIVRAGQELAPAEDAFGEERLRSLSWEEIVVRLGAARDFRRLMERQLNAGGGSFNADSARHLAAHGDVKPGINPFALSDRKIATCMDFASSEAARGDRGRQ